MEKLALKAILARKALEASRVRLEDKAEMDFRVPRAQMVPLEPKAQRAPKAQLVKMVLQENRVRLVILDKMVLLAKTGLQA